MASTLHRYRARKNFSTRLRRLAPWRGRTRLGRATAVLLSMLLALMMLGTAGPAYAEGTAPEEPAPEMSTLAAEEPAAEERAAEPQVPGEKAPEPQPKPEGAAAAEEQAEPDAPETEATEPTPQAATTELAPLALEALAAITIPCADAANSVVIGGFEIDGNLCVQGNTDWDSGVGDSEDDGFDDATTFGGGSAENTNPSTWENGPAPNDKSDIGTAYAYSRAVSGTVYTFFGVTNDSTSGGTGQYDFEYNQSANVTNPQGLSVPNRTPGDLLFRFSGTGSAPLVFEDAKRYTLASDPAWSASKCFTTGVTPAAGWCDVTIPAGVFTGKASASGEFLEGAINLSALFGQGNCTGTFGTVNVRSVTGGAFATSSLKDRVAPLGVNTPSTCGSLKIEKKQLTGDTLLPGAIYAITDDPRPGMASPLRSVPR